jgi:hypothetical protein
MDQAELLAARAAVFGGIMAAALIYWFQGDADTTRLVGLLVAVAVSTWAAYVLGAWAIHQFVPELD